jgi:hypothetical protein
MRTSNIQHRTSKWEKIEEVTCSVATQSTDLLEKGPCHRSLFRVHSWFEISPKESALRGRIALPCEEEVTSSSIRNPLSTIGNLAGFVSIRVHSWFEISPKESALRGRIALPEIVPKKDRAVLQRRGLNFCSN